MFKGKRKISIGDEVRVRFGEKVYSKKTDSIWQHQPHPLLFREEFRVKGLPQQKREWERHEKKEVQIFYIYFDLKKDWEDMCSLHEKHNIVFPQLFDDFVRHNGDKIAQEHNYKSVVKLLFVMALALETDNNNWIRDYSFKLNDLTAIWSPKTKTNSKNRKNIIKIIKQAFESLERLEFFKGKPVWQTIDIGSTQEEHITFDFPGDFCRL